MTRWPSLLAVSLSLATACGVREEGADARAIGERFVAAFGKNDRQELLALLDPDVRWKAQGMNGREGQTFEGLAEFFEELKLVFPDAAIDPAEVLAEGSRVDVIGRLTGTQKGNWDVIEPSGRRIDVYCHARLVVDAGRIRSVQWLHDAMDALHQLDVLDDELGPLYEGWFKPGRSFGPYPPKSDWVVAALDMSPPVRALSLDPFSFRESPRPPDRDSVTGHRTAFRGFRITGSGTVEDPEQREDLRGLLFEGLSMADGSALCFQPRHALELEHQGRKIWIVICFECQSLYFEHEDGRSHGFSISSIVEPRFSAIYRSLGLTIASR